MCGFDDDKEENKTEAAEQEDRNSEYRFNFVLCFLDDFGHVIPLSQPQFPQSDHLCWIRELFPPQPFF